MCSLGAIASPITSKTGRAALLGGVAGTLLSRKNKVDTKRPVSIEPMSTRGGLAGSY